IQASSPKVLFGCKRASILLQPVRRSFFVQVRLNLPSASHSPVGFGRYVCISRRSVVHNLAIPPDPHVVLWGSGGMGEGMSTVITGLNPKGGVSKTVTSIFVATALARQGSVTVVDADPRASATEWALTAQDRKSTRLNCSH